MINPGNLEPPVACGVMRRQAIQVPLTLSLTTIHSRAHTEEIHMAIQGREVYHKSYVQSLAVVLRGAFSLLSDSYSMYVPQEKLRGTSQHMLRCKGSSKISGAAGGGDMAGLRNPKCAWLTCTVAICKAYEACSKKPRDIMQRSSFEEDPAQSDQRD